MKTHLDPNPPPVAPIDEHAADVAAEQTGLIKTARCAEFLRSGQKARAVRIGRQYIKYMPGWLRAMLLEKPENTS